MKNILYSIILLFAINTIANSQTCFPNGITFSTQQQIDSFIINYPDCTEIGGDVYISSKIYDLKGLKNIERINGTLTITYTQIEDCNGLDNLKDIGDLIIIRNSHMQQLSGFNKLEKINGELIIGFNGKLNDISGMNNLNTIGNLKIEYNFIIRNLSGFSNLQKINGNLIIQNNSLLDDITNLSNLDSINGYININNNDNLKSLTGIDNICPATIKSKDTKYFDIVIYNNKKLNDCSVSSICGLLDIDNHTSKIYNNKSGCNTKWELKSKCSNFCHEGNITFLNQSQIDKFPKLHPDCNSINGSLIIKKWANNINNLDSLIQLKTINGNIEILNTSNLKSLNGLDNLAFVNGNLKLINNKSLLNIDHLDSLFILNGNIEIKNNSNLKNFIGLTNLQYIDGYIIIKDNPQLTDISGISNINLNSIKSKNSINKDISITNNPKLSNCSIANICTGISLNNISTSFNNNNTGCNDINEIYNACEGDCLQSGIVFSTQEEIDNFSNRFNWCTDIKGNVLIGNEDYSKNYSINNLLGLTNIKNIKGNLSVYRSIELENLNGLHNIKSIEKTLDISYNNKLKDLYGLRNIESVGDNLIFTWNENLENLHGLERLNKIGKILYFFYNKKMKNLKGLDSLNSIGEELVFFESNINSLEGIERLKELGGFVADFSSLKSLSPLENLNKFTGSLFLLKTDLVDISAIEGIDDLSIRYNKNTNITDLYFLDDLDYSYDLLLEDNDSLSDCSIESLCRYLNLSGKKTKIENNKEGCNSIEEVKDSCKFELYPNLIFPKNGDMNIPTNITIMWDTIHEALGYKLSLGTESNNYAILDNFDVGNVDYYDLVNLPCDKTIYIKITPYDSLGIINDGQEESFTTEGKASIQNDSLKICYGEDVQLFADGGSIYHWYPSNGLDNVSISNPIASPKETTSYKVVVENGSNCIDSTQLTVFVNPQISINITKTDESATNSQDGTASIIVVGGTAPYSYRWSTGDTTKKINNLSPAKYYITVTDAENCSKKDSIIIQKFECSQIEIEKTQKMVSCFGNCDGSLSIDSIRNGISPFSFTWSNGGTTSKIDSLCAGNYSLTIVDGNNCNINKTFTILEPNELTVEKTIIHESSNDANDGSILIQVNGGTEPYSYSWSNGANNQLLTNLSPGDYQYTITDVNGCSISDTINIMKYICTTLEANSQVSNVSCYNNCDGSIEISDVNNATLPITYNWNNGASSSSLTNICASEYNVTITDAKNCSITQDFNISQPDEIVITIDSTRDVRLDPLGYIAITTNDTGNYTFTWFGPNNFLAFDEDIFDLGAYGCYTVRVTDTITNCSIDSTICLANKTSVLEFELDNISIYPNPTKGSFTLDFTNSEVKQAEITLYDLSGKQQYNIEKKPNDRLLKINPKNLSNGLYIIRIRTEKCETIYRKILFNKLW